MEINFVIISREHISAYLKFAQRKKKTIACVGSRTPRVEAVAAKKNALLQIDAIAPVYALLVRFRHERGRSARLEGDVI